MAGYLFVDTGTLKALGQAGLLDQLLPANNGGMTTIITHEVYGEINTAYPLGQTIVKWLNEQLPGQITFTGGTGESYQYTGNDGEQSIAFYLKGGVDLGGFSISQGSPTLVLNEDVKGMRLFITPYLNSASPLPETSTGFISNQVISGRMTYEQAIQGWDGVVTNKYVMLNPPNSTDPDGVNIFGTSAVGNTGVGRQIGPSTVNITGTDGLVVGHLDFSGFNADGSAGSVTFTNVGQGRFASNFTVTAKTLISVNSNAGSVTFSGQPMEVAMTADDGTPVQFIANSATFNADGSANFMGSGGVSVNFDPDGHLIPNTQQNDNSTYVSETSDYTLTGLIGPMPTFTPDQIGVVFGSMLGSLLAQGNSLEAIPISTALGITLGSFVKIVESANGSNVSDLVRAAASNVPDEVKSMGASAVTSYLIAELLNAAGVKGFVAGVINTASSVTIGRIAANLALQNPAFANIADTNFLGLSIGSFVGSELGSLILPAQTQDGQLGGSLGSAVTAIVASTLLADATVSPGTLAFLAAAGIDSAGTELATNVAVTTIADALGIEAGTLLSFAIPVVGAIVGYLAGTFIGDLIAGPPGKSWAAGMISVTPTGPENATFVAGAVASDHHGPVSFAQDLVNATTAALNAVLADIGGQVVAPGAVTPFQIGVWDGHLKFSKPGFVKDYFFADAGQLQTYAVAATLQQILQTGGIAGGDIYVKRALQSYLANALTNLGYDPIANGQNASPLIAGDLSALTGDVSIAQSYEEYVNNTAVIDALIVASPNSAFAAGWLVTLQAADALGLDRRATTDWTGGWGSYLASLKADPEQLSAALLSNARMITVGATTIADTIASSGKDVITDTAANDTISIDANGVLQANGNVLFDGVAATTSQASHIAAVIYAGPGNSVVYAGGQGDDVIGWTGAGYGNEYLAAGWMTFRDAAVPAAPTAAVSSEIGQHAPGG